MLKIIMIAIIPVAAILALLFELALSAIEKWRQK